MDIMNNISKISIDDAKNKLTEYKYALVYGISSVLFDTTESISEINWDECKEAYFFDEKGQLHIYESDDGLCAVQFCEPEEVKYIDKKYVTAGKYKKIAGKIIRREYIDFDEDGQMFIAYTRLVSAE